MQSGLSERQIGLLAEQGIFTIHQLANATKEQILNLRGGGTGVGWQEYRGGPFRYVCPHKRLAEAIMAQCQLSTKLADGIEFDARVGILQPIYGLPPGQEEPPPEDLGDLDGCHPEKLEPEIAALRDEEELREIRKEKRILRKLMPDKEIDFICKIVPPSRSYAASAVVANNFYVSGGYAGHNDYRNDLWYRDDELPYTWISTKPRNDTSDAEFEFDATNEIGCIFEYVSSHYSL